MARRRLTLVWANGIRQLQAAGVPDGEILIEVLRYAESEERRIAKAFADERKRLRKEMNDWRTA